MYNQYGQIMFSAFHINELPIVYCVPGIL